MLPEVSFAVDRSKRSGLKSWCKECDAARCRAYYEANFEARLAAAAARNAIRREERGPRLCIACGEPATSSRHHYCDRCRASRPRHRRRELERAREQRRNRASSTDRGYGWEHQKLRKQVAAVVASGMASCARCGGRISPDDPWDLGHDDLDRSRYTGPEHRSCNRATARHKAERGVSREW